MAQKRRGTTPASADVSDAVVKAALYAGELNLSQAQIAKIFSPASQSSVSRMLVEAEEFGCLVRETKFVGDSIDRDRLERLRTEVRMNQVTSEVAESYQRLCGKTALRRIYVIPHREDLREPDSTRTADQSLAALEAFASSASSTIEQLLSTASQIGVTWGSTIAYCVEAMRRQTSARLRYGRSTEANSQSTSYSAQIFPLAGELSGSGGRADFGSTSLAHKLFDVLGSPGGKSPPTLTGLLAFLPFTKAELGDLKNREDLWARLFPDGYDAIFGSQGAIHTIDCVLTSISATHQPYGDRIDQLARASGKKIDYIKEAFVGDVGGVLLPASKSRAVEELRKDIASKRTGINTEQLSAIALRATKDGRIPGIVAVSRGKEKARVLVDAIKAGLVTNAIVDRELADEAIRLMQP